jgi:SGNH hydrolase-like domain, acetyltransferase AlgX
MSSPAPAPRSSPTIRARAAARQPRATRLPVARVGIGEPGPDAFKTPLQARGVSFIDLTPPFRAQAANSAPLFFEIDGHPNAEGYRLIARVVTEHLRKRGGMYGLWE